jgi:hypothetical protein
MMLPHDHQNPVDIHTSIMCINILQNIKVVGGDSRTNHVSISGRTDRGKLICLLLLPEDEHDDSVSQLLIRVATLSVSIP